MREPLSLAGYHASPWIVEPFHLLDCCLVSNGAICSRTAFAMAGCGPADVTLAQIYDCYTYALLTTLEDYGFCARGESGPFVQSGALAPGGKLPTNTGEGTLSGCCTWGMTPISEAVIQARGDGGERQVERNGLIVVSGNGGIFNHHATLVLLPRTS